MVTKNGVLRMTDERGDSFPKYWGKKKKKKKKKKAEEKS